MINYYAQEAAQTAIDAGLGGAVPMAILSTLLSLAVVAVMVVFVIAGCYQGSVKSASSMVAMLVALLLARLFMPVMAGSLAERDGVVEQLIYYSDAEDILGTIKVWSQPAGDQTEEELTAMVAASSLPRPLDDRFVSNVREHRFEAEGAVTLADYMSYTIAYYTLNTLAFFMLFVLCYVVLYVALHMADQVLHFPVIRFVDVPLGGAIGLVRGLVAVHVLFVLMPMVLAFLPLEQIATIVENADVAAFFLDHNVFLGWIRAAL